MIGKRKRDTVVARREVKAEEESVQEVVADQDAHDLFRKYFEARFDPLPQSHKVVNSTAEIEGDEDIDIEDEHDDRDEEIDENTSDEMSETSEWSGLSEDAVDVPVVEVVDYGQQVGQSETDPQVKALQKSFMSSLPPRDINRPSQTKTTPATAEDEKGEQTNLKYDLDLQRLLRESHLLEQTKSSAMPGKQRHKATDMRMQDLGSKTSLFKQEKMPISHAVGIRKKAATKETQRRSHARENGIILEKAQSKSAKSAPKRERGVDVPGLGKFRGGTLKLSRADIASMQSGAGRGGKRKGGR